MPQFFPKVHQVLTVRTYLRTRVSVLAMCAMFVVSVPAAAQKKTPPSIQHPADTARNSRAGADLGSQKVSIETSQPLFATMCALWAAGYGSESATVGFPPAWRAIAAQMYQSKGPAADAIRAYYQKHEHQDASVTLTRFISFAMVVGPPPDFKYTLRHDDLPPDVLTIEDFNDLLGKFYQEQQIDRVWRRIAPAYQLPTELLQEPMTKIVLQTTGYLREVLASDSPRTFTVYIEPLVGSENNFRSYADEYAFIVNGDADPPLDQLRHAFLHFLIDPIPPRYPGSVMADRAVIQLAARAPQLPSEYREDYIGYYTECLIKAVELRLDHLPAPKLASALDSDDSQGYVLVRPLYAGLDQFQQAEPAMKFYFPTLAKSVDITAETKRVAAIQFAPAAAPPAISASERDAQEKEQMLELGEQLLSSQDGVGAQAQFEKVLARWPGTPRAEYGLAIAAVLQRQGRKAEELFTALVQPPPNTEPIADPVILAWAHVYLGRIHDMESERDQAVTEYHAALSVPGAPEAARAAAQTGLQQAYQPARKGDHSGGHP